MRAPGSNGRDRVTSALLSAPPSAPVLKFRVGRKRQAGGGDTKAATAGPGRRHDGRGTEGRETATAPTHPERRRRSGERDPELGRGGVRGGGRRHTGAHVRPRGGVGGGCRRLPTSWPTK
jgi:hypothetical protein